MKFASQVPDTDWTIDRIAIQDVISSVSLHSDLREPTQVYQYYTDDAVMEHATLFGEEGSTLPVRAQRERLMDFYPGFDSVHHQTTNFQISIDGDEAVSRAQVRATHRIGDDLWVVGGTYHQRLRRTATGWKISYHRFELAYVEGANLVERARARVNARSSA